MKHKIKTLLTNIVYNDGKQESKLFEASQLKRFKKTKTFKQKIISITIEKTLTFTVDNNVKLTIKN